MLMHAEFVVFALTCEHFVIAGCSSLTLGRFLHLLHNSREQKWRLGQNRKFLCFRSPFSVKGRQQGSEELSGLSQLQKLLSRTFWSLLNLQVDLNNCSVENSYAIESNLDHFSATPTQKHGKCQNGKSWFIVNCIRFQVSHSVSNVVVQVIFKSYIDDSIQPYLKNK